MIAEALRKPSRNLRFATSRFKRNKRHSSNAVPSNEKSPPEYLIGCSATTTNADTVAATPTIATTATASTVVLLVLLLMVLLSWTEVSKRFGN